MAFFGFVFMLIFIGLAFWLMEYVVKLVWNKMLKYLVTSILADYNKKPVDYYLNKYPLIGDKQAWCIVGIVLLCHIILGIR